MFVKPKNSTMLPEAHQASTWSNAWFECSPRHSCYFTQRTRSLTRQEIPPPAGRNWTSFFTNMWLCEPHVCEKDQKRTMLPQAHRAATWSNAWFECSPRHSCEITGVTRSLVWTRILPLAGRKISDRFHKKIHVVKFFVKPIKQYHVPQANQASTWSNVQFSYLPCKSCYFTPAAARSVSALSVRSQGTSISSRPK
jgi:hypothetical protein